MLFLFCSSYKYTGTRSQFELIAAIEGVPKETEATNISELRKTKNAWLTKRQRQNSILGD